MLVVRPLVVVITCFLGKNKYCSISYNRQDVKTIYVSISRYIGKDVIYLYMYIYTHIRTHTHSEIVLSHIKE